MGFLNLLQESPVLLLTLTGIIGLLFGSFLNVVIHRLPLIMERRWRNECNSLLGGDDNNGSDPQQPFDLLTPRSRCPGCETQISAWHNIPLISWLLLRGRCKFCQIPISIQYPLVEAVTAIMAIVVVLHFGASAQAMAAVVLTWALIALSGIDWNTTLLPDDITLPLLWLGLVCNSFDLFTNLHSAVIGAIFGYLILWVVYHAFRVVTGKEGMGYGDFKLLAALGAWLGWQHLPVIILVSSLVGAVVGVTLIAVQGKDKNTAIPFGPYLAGAGWISLIWGDQLASLYYHLVLT